MIAKIAQLLSYHPYVTTAKIAVALNSAAAILLFACLFFYFYRKYFWKNQAARELFWLVNIIFAFIVSVKFVIGVLYQGYIPELTFFFAIPSPKLLGFGWLLAAAGVFLFFLYFRKKIESLSTFKFLAILFAVFFVFSVSVAGVREGTVSIADPFTKVYWEYTGNIPLISSAKNFLHDYITLEPRLARHSITHPPGYSLLLYFFHKLFAADFLGLSLLVVLIAGFALWPLLFLFRCFLTETEARRALEILIFIPSLVMMTATSMEGFFMLAVWSAIALCYLGWKKNIWLAVLGGVAAAISFFSNFLFLLLGPFFVLLGGYTLKDFLNAPQERLKIIMRMFFSLLSFFLFFAVIWQWSQYSISDNFFAARSANSFEVESNFKSVSTYLMYLLMNIASFLTYLGLPLIIIFFTGLPKTFKESNFLFKSGVGVLALFLLVGIFQGNVERLWLFILPFFIVFPNKLWQEENQILFNAALSLLFFQIIMTQAIFYTFY